MAARSILVLLCALLCAAAADARRPQHACVTCGQIDFVVVIEFAHADSVAVRCDARCWLRSVRLAVMHARHPSGLLCSGPCVPWLLVFLTLAQRQRVEALLALTCDAAGLCDRIAISDHARSDCAQKSERFCLEKRSIVTGFSLVCIVGSLVGATFEWQVPDLRGNNGKYLWKYSIKN